jgi:hypothetical protein
LAVTIDRRRAELTLFGLCAFTTLMAAFLIGYDLIGGKLLNVSGGADGRDAVVSAAALGVVMAAATLDYAIERLETRGTRYFSRAGGLVLVLPILALVVCVAAVAFFSPAPMIFSTFTALTLFLIVLAVRRLGVGTWWTWTGAALAILLPAAIAISQARLPRADIVLQFALDATSPAVTAAERMLADTGWLGNGAGSFDTLLPLYQTAATGGPQSVPTSATAIALGWGRPALIGFILAAFALTAMLLHGSLDRGRDSFYPAAAASGVVLVLFEAFLDDSLLGTMTAIVVAVLLGLGCAQRISRKIA